MSVVSGQAPSDVDDLDVFQGVLVPGNDPHGILVDVCVHRDVLDQGLLTGN